MKAILFVFFVFLSTILAFPQGSPICSINPGSMSQIATGMGGPLFPVGSQGNVTMTANATTAVAGSTITITYVQPALLIIGFHLIAEYQRDLTIQGSFNLNNSVPAGYAIYVNASFNPCPAGSNHKGAITHSNVLNDYGLMVYQYTSDINLPGVYVFRSIVSVDGNYLPDARSDWFIINPVVVTFTAAPGFTGFPSTATPPTTATPVTTAAANAAAPAPLTASQIAGVVIGVALGVLLIAVFLFPIIWAATHRHDPRVMRFTQRMTRSFGRS